MLDGKDAVLRRFYSWLGFLAGLTLAVALLSAPLDQVRAEGYFAHLIEKLCGNCGAGRELDEAHKRMGSPLDSESGLSREAVVATLAPLLADAIRQSRDDARDAGTLPMPASIREKLLRVYPFSLLEGVRYRVHDGDPLSVQGASFRFGDANAVTLIDTVIFSSATNAEQSAVIWAHEIKHVEQYRRWGLADFAARYVRDWEAVEKEAYDAAFAYQKDAAKSEAVE